MKLFIAENNEALSKKLADDLLSEVEKIAQPLLCVASGDSPAGLYKELSLRLQKQELNVQNWNFVGLDEWLGMNGKEEGSCRYHLDQQLFHPLQIKEERICFFDGHATDPEAECRRIENFIRQKAGIDLAIVGLGMNGHVGMNEPGTGADTAAHLAPLDAVTSQVGQKYFREKQELVAGLTLGIADLLEARSIFLVVNGLHKADIVQQMLEGPISEQLPASLLRQHPALSVYLDKAAATRIGKEHDAS